MSEAYNVNQVPDGGITSDDKLWAALAYIFSPIIPIVLLLMEDKKNRPFIKAHTMQALLVGIAGMILIPILATITCGVGAVVWLLFLYWAYQAYQGKYINIPGITNFVKAQGWA